MAFIIQYMVTVPSTFTLVYMVIFGYLFFLVHQKTADFVSPPRHLVLASCSCGTCGGWTTCWSRWTWKSGSAEQKGGSQKNNDGWERFHPGRLTGNLQITNLERNMIFQTSMIMFHVNLQGCMLGGICLHNHYGIYMLYLYISNKHTVHILYIYIKHMFILNIYIYTYSLNF